MEAAHAASRRQGGAATDDNAATTAECVQRESDSQSPEHAPSLLARKMMGSHLAAGCCACCARRCASLSPDLNHALCRLAASSNGTAGGHRLRGSREQFSSLLAQVSA